MMELLIGAGAVFGLILFFVLLGLWMSKSRIKRYESNKFAESEEDDFDEDEYYVTVRKNKESDKDHCAFCGSEGHSMPGCPVFLSTTMNS